MQIDDIVKFLFPEFAYQFRQTTVQKMQAVDIGIRFEDAPKLDFTCKVYLRFQLRFYRSYNRGSQNNIADGGKPYDEDLHSSKIIGLPLLPAENQLLY